MATGQTITLPAGAARHVQVLRLQPGSGITLFNGLQPSFGEFDATVTRMGRSDVDVEIGAHHRGDREADRAVHLALGMPANDRMDWLIEKATELGVASVQPLMSERSVLRLAGERADKKQAHWQSIAIAACEQCGRNRVPTVHPVLTLALWLKQNVDTTDKGSTDLRCLLSLRDGGLPLRSLFAASTATQPTQAVTFLSGPEGGLSDAEESAALASGFRAVTLGPRVLRAETAALAALTLLV